MKFFELTESRVQITLEIVQVQWSHCGLTIGYFLIGRIRLSNRVLKILLVNRNQIVQRKNCLFLIVTTNHCPQDVGLEKFRKNRRAQNHILFRFWGSSNVIISTTIFGWMCFFLLLAIKIEVWSVLTWIQNFLVWYSERLWLKIVRMENLRRTICLVKMNCSKPLKLFLKIRGKCLDLDEHSIRVCPTHLQKDNFLGCWEWFWFSNMTSCITVEVLPQVLSFQMMKL